MSVQNLITKTWLVFYVVTAFTAPGRAETFYTPRQLPVHPEIRVGFPQRISNLDPAKVSAGIEAFLVRNLFEGLVRRDPNTGEVQLAIAKTIEREPSGRQFRCILHRSPKWSDGRFVVAKDFAYAFNRLTSSFPVKKAVAIDDRTLILHLVTPRTTKEMLLLLTETRFLPVPQHIIDRYPGSSWTHGGLMTSNGPYLLSQTNWQQSHNVSLQVNPNYWQSSIKMLPPITIRSYTTTKSLESGFYKGEVDTMSMEAAQFHAIFDQSQAGIKAYMQQYSGSQWPLFFLAATSNSNGPSLMGFLQNQGVRPLKHEKW